MKSLLFQGTTVLTLPSSCVSLPCRQEVTVSLRKDNRLYNYVVRDKIVPEDPYIVMIKALAFAVRYSSVYPGAEPPKAVRDFLIKSSVVVL